MMRENAKWRNAVNSSEWEIKWTITKSILLRREYRKIKNRRRKIRYRKERNSDRNHRSKARNQWKLKKTRVTKQVNLNYPLTANPAYNPFITNQTNFPKSLPCMGKIRLSYNPVKPAQKPQNLRTQSSANNNITKSLPLRILLQKIPTSKPRSSPSDSKSIPIWENNCPN